MYRGTVSERRLPRPGLSYEPTTSVPTLSGQFLEEYEGKILYCLDLLTDDEVWWRPGPHTNSVGNLVLHVCGNLSHWILVMLGGSDYKRRRSEEFAADRTAGAAELGTRLTQVVGNCVDVLATFPADDLSRVQEVQTYTTTNLGAIYHAVEHMAYHTGQIVFVAKQLAGERASLEFYARHAGE